MPTDMIRYDLLVQDALKGVVRKVLTSAARDGIPGEHHFYLSFRTGDKGVRISQALREKYPTEMTIVLQHQFWDLSVSEHIVEVGLSFSGAPEKLVIPFDAISGFFDPSVQFGLKFELSTDGAATGSAKALPAAKADNGEPAVPALPVPSVQPDTGRASRKASEKPGKSAGGEGKLKIAPPAKGEARDEAEDEAKDEPNVISLDAFRKKP